MRTIVASVILAIGVIVGGYLLGNGLLRAKQADRSVTVRGLAERDVVADIATWSLSYSAQGRTLSEVQEEIDADTQAIRNFLQAQGFEEQEITITNVGVNEWRNNQGIPNITINQTLQLRTRKIEDAVRASAAQSDLVRRGVALQGGGVNYSFTRLNDVKPEMIALATKNAREAAEQFAKDSGATVGSIRSANQGYFSIQARDGEGNANTPNKKVRVVTSVDFYLTD